MKREGGGEMEEERKIILLLTRQLASTLCTVQRSELVPAIPLSTSSGSRLLCEDHVRIRPSDQHQTHSVRERERHTHESTKFNLYVHIYKHDCVL